MQFKGSPKTVASALEKYKTSYDLQFEPEVPLEPEDPDSAFAVAGEIVDKLTELFLNKFTQ